MKVLQVNAVYGHGSTGTIVRDIENLCYENGIECFVASPDPKVLSAKKGYRVGSFFDHKLHALLCRINGEQAYFSKRATKKFIKFIENVKPDIIHLHDLHSNYINLPIFLKYLASNNIPTILTLHDCWFYTGGCFHYTYVKCNKWMYECGDCPKKLNDTPSYFLDKSSEILLDRKKLFLSIPNLQVIGVSNWIASEAKKSYFAHSIVKVIYNGIDFDTFRNTPSDFRNRLHINDRFVILGPGSKWLEPANRKVLDAFSGMMKEDEILVLFGVLENKTNIPQNVIAIGYTNSRQELAELYSMADVFANCSREESLSLINIEAQACETPIVTFGATGMKETVDEISSFSVPVGDAVSLYQKVSFIRDQLELGFSFKCRDFVMNRFSIIDNYINYIQCYQEAVKSKDN